MIHNKYILFFISHLMRKNLETMYLYKCPICGVKYKSGAGLRKHLKDYHFNEKDYYQGVHLKRIL